MQHTAEHDAWTHRSRLTAATIGLAAALTNFDVTSVVVVLPSIGTTLGIPVANWAWIIDAYSLAFTATLLVAGAMADRFGRRRMLLIGNVNFLVASLACGLAWNSSVFLAARAAQGGAAAFLVTGGFASIATAFPKPEARARAFGIAGVASGVAMALGPSLGGIIGTGLGWRWIFLANFPFCILIALAVPRLVAELREETDKPLDWPGVAILTIALGLIIQAILEARNAPVRMAIGLGVGSALGVWFAIRQRRQARPMLDPALLTSRPMIGVTVLLVTVSVGYWSILMYLPLYLGTAFGWTTEAVGLAMLIATLPMLVVPPFGSHLVPRLGWRRLFTMALGLIALGGAALALSALAGPAARICIFAGMTLIGVGAALSHPQLSGAVIALAPPEASGMASALTVIARQTGFALGVAMLGALTPVSMEVVGFAWLFGSAAMAAVGGMLACLLLLPPSSGTSRA
ncbi:MFS transporter permease [Methylobacterium radiotolerans]|nr:MFS transporter permease [Methylobacterium radiotolerans]KTS45747.1 MFS transporter permease [Methylobacterium radiotolerans]